MDGTHRTEQAGQTELDEEGELPPLDGDESDPEDPDASALLDDEIVDDDDGLDPLDDSTGEGDPVEELAEEERSWLTDAEPAEGLEVGAFDALELGGVEAEERVAGAVLDDDDEPGVEGEDFGLDEGNLAQMALDGGEEGPRGPDEELREADLPALDADDEGDLDDAILEDVTLEDDAPLPWDASPWERVLLDHASHFDFPPMDADAESYEKTLSRLGLAKMTDLRVTAEGHANGTVLVALVSRIAGRAWLLHVPASFARGEARIVAEVGGAAFGDDPEILSLAWDETRGVAWVGGLFGLLAFRPRTAS